MIVKNFKYSCLLIIISVIAAIIVGIICGGLNLGIDFTGGSIITYKMGTTFDSEEVRDLIAGVDGVGSSVSVVTSGDKGDQAIVRLQNTGGESADTEIADNILTVIKEKFSDAELGTISSVGGVASGDMIKNAISSVLIAGVLMLIYIWIRFDLASGLGAFLALAHDVIVMVALMCVFQIQIDSTFIAACLTIVGYSINATVITYDRIRENSVKLNPREYTKAQIVDYSVKQTMGRNINTSVTTLIMVAALYIFGVNSIQIFTLPLIVGIIAGTFSSILIAPALWMLFSDRIAKGKKHRSKKAIR